MFSQTIWYVQYMSGHSVMRTHVTLVSSMLLVLLGLGAAALRLARISNLFFHSLEWSKLSLSIFQHLLTIFLGKTSGSTCSIRMTTSLSSTSYNLPDSRTGNTRVLVSWNIKLSDWNVTCGSLRHWLEPNKIETSILKNWSESYIFDLYLNA